jgi:hypothetical protein
VKSIGVFNKHLTKHKVTFDKASNLLDLVFMVIKDFEEVRPDLGYE